MYGQMSKGKNKKYWSIGLLGMVIGFALMITANTFYHKSSKNESCMSCHYHEETDNAWKMSMHYNGNTGVKTDCAACHLPPEGSIDHFVAKAKAGMKDVWSYITKDKEDIDWQIKKELEYAQKIVYNKSCLECHVSLYPQGISDDGLISHLYFDDNKDKYDLQCISCHLNAGHYDPNYTHQRMTGIPVSTSANTEIYSHPAEVTSFETFTETIPGTTASIKMVAVPGGTFKMGSPEQEPFHQADEAPLHDVTVSSFFMAETEITWDQYWAFYGATMSEGRTPPSVVYENNAKNELDAISGPTPPFGNPDQGWGQGDRPAITMTYYGAQTFCQWLSLKTGRTYRLPTEAEWEYAARAGSQTPYFFEGDPKKFSNEGFLKGIFKPDTIGINRFAIYVNNSRNRTAEPSKVAANPFGLKNMYGNVMEYCSDWYAEDAYSKVQSGAVNPTGPAEGTEHVVRGGFYAADASLLRSASRSHTDHDRWLKTDPQNPKSIWWYSDIKGIGFRVVCEVPQEIQQ